MRTKARERRAEMRENIVETEEQKAERRARGRDKYYRGIELKNRRKIDAWLKDSNISLTFKAFLRQNVLTVVDMIPASFLETCEEYLSIAVIQPNNNITEIVDNESRTPTASSSISEGSEKEEDEGYTYF